MNAVRDLQKPIKYVKIMSYLLFITVICLSIFQMITLDAEAVVTESERIAGRKSPFSVETYEILYYVQQILGILLVFSMLACFHVGTTYEDYTDYLQVFIYMSGFCIFYTCVTLVQIFMSFGAREFRPEYALYTITGIIYIIAYSFMFKYSRMVNNTYKAYILNGNNDPSIQLSGYNIQVQQVTTV